jgi:hypothetical protein
VTGGGDAEVIVQTSLQSSTLEAGSTSNSLESTQVCDTKSRNVSTAVASSASGGSLEESETKDVLKGTELCESGASNISNASPSKNSFKTQEHSSKSIANSSKNAGFLTSASKQTPSSVRQAGVGPAGRELSRPLSGVQRGKITKKGKQKLQNLLKQQRQAPQSVGDSLSNFLNSLK